MLKLSAKEIIFYGSSKLESLFPYGLRVNMYPRGKTGNGWLASHRICDRVISIVGHNLNIFTS